MEAFSLVNHAVIVTGAAGQLGRAIVNGLLDCGSKVVAVDIDHELLKNTAEREKWPSNQVITQACDISSRQSIVSLFNTTNEINLKITGLVNNAGVSVFEPYLERPAESIDFVNEVNLRGTIMMTQEYFKACNDGGAIVNVGSIYGIVSPDPNIYTDCARVNSEIYGATKAGVIQLTKYYAVNGARLKIRVNCISPGGVFDPVNPQGNDFIKNYVSRCPMGRMADAKDMVGGTIFLLSDAASYITGQNLVIDGGYSAW